MPSFIALSFIAYNKYGYPHHPHPHLRTRLLPLRWNKGIKRGISTLPSTCYMARSEFKAIVCSCVPAYLCVLFCFCWLVGWLVGRPFSTSLFRQLCAGQICLDFLMCWNSDTDKICYVTQSECIEAVLISLDADSTLLIFTSLSWISRNLNLGPHCCTSGGHVYRHASEVVSTHTAWPDQQLYEAIKHKQINIDRLCA